MMVPEFKYNGLCLHELPHVSAMPEGVEQLAEIDRRIKALYDYSREYSLAMTSVHIRNVLAVSEATYLRYKHGKLGNVDVAMQDQEKQDFVKARSTLIKRWESIADGFCMDKVSTDPQPGRSVYIAKSMFGHWDTPGVDKESGTPSIEVIIREKAVREARKNKNSG